MLAVLDRIEMEEKKIREKCKTEGVRQGIKLGIKEGIKTGKKEGISKTKLEIAKEMLKEKIDINKISKCTKLNKSEIEKIQKEFEEEN